VPDSVVLLKYSARNWPAGQLAPVVVENVAVTATFVLPVNVHGPVPEHPPPLQPSNRDPALAVAVSVTTVPLGKASLQSLPQLIPLG
jgi:hypothetical protein